MKKVLKNMKKKEVSKKVIVENDVSMEEAVRTQIDYFYETHKNREFFFKSVAIGEKFEDYAVYLPTLRENFKRDFFIYWCNMSNLIAMRIEIEEDSVLIIKKQFA